MFSAVSRSAAHEDRHPRGAWPPPPFARPPSAAQGLAHLLALHSHDLWQLQRREAAVRDRAAAPTRPLGAPTGGRRRKLRSARVPRPSPVLCQRANMAPSTPESDVELARRQREGVFTPPPHWKPRQEEVDLKKDYAFKRAQREGGVFDPVEVTGAPEKELL